MNSQSIRATFGFRDALFYLLKSRGLRISKWYPNEAGDKLGLTASTRELHSAFYGSDCHIRYYDATREWVCVLACDTRDVTIPDDRHGVGVDSLAAFLDEALISSAPREQHGQGSGRPASIQSLPEAGNHQDRHRKQAWVQSKRVRRVSGRGSGRVFF